MILQLEDSNQLNTGTVHSKHDHCIIVTAHTLKFSKYLNVWLAYSSFALLTNTNIYTIELSICSFICPVNTTAVLYSFSTVLGLDGMELIFFIHFLELPLNQH